MIKRIIKQIETPIDLITQIITELGGGGGSSQQYIDGEVEYHQYLPTGIGIPPTNVAFIVKKGQGIWLINRKPAGIWVRETDNGNLNDWIYAGSFPDVYNDANFRIYDNDDSSKNLAFNLNDLNTNTTVTLTIPPSGGTIITSNDTGVFYTRNNPSGYITSQNVVYTTGDQTISGLKDFATRPTVNTIPVALSGESASSIEQLVKNDSNTTLYKGQPVYVSGSNGNNILIHPASNSGEGTSSKTFGLLKQTLLNNAQGYVVTEGPLLNVDTSMANEGDPIWLGPTGNLIYGLANKPKAPQHLVYLGFVERAHQNQGKIFVKVQNGFEIEELHDVRIINKQNSDILIYNTGSGLWLNSGVNFDAYATVTNLATTGSTLQTNVNTVATNLATTGSTLQTNIGNLSGYVNSSNSNIVFTTGAQTITGQKTFDTIIANQFSGGQFSGPSNSNLIISARGQQILTADSNQIYLTKQLSAQGQNITNVTSLALNWGNGGTFIAGGSNGVIDQRDGTNPQNLRIFNATGISPASGEFGQIGWSGNTFVIGAFNTNSGIARNLELHSPLGRRIIVTTAGHVGIGTSAGDQTQHGLWVNPAAGQTSITHGGGQIFLNGTSVMFHANTRIFPNNAFTFGINQNNTTPMIRGVNVGSGFTSIQARLADNSNFVNLEANKLIANSGADIYFSGITGTGVSGSHVGVLVSGLWNNTGQTYTGILYNITLSSGIAPSITNSLLNVSVNNTGVFNINGRGDAIIRRASANTEFTDIVTVSRGTTAVFGVRDDGATQAVGFSTPLQAGHSTMNAFGFAVRNIGSFAISSDGAAFSPDVFLRRDGPGIFAQYNGLNPQQYRIYNLTGTNSGEFGLFGWQNNNLIIGAQQTQSGALRDLTLTGQNINLSASGVIIPNPTVPTSTGSAGVRGQISWDNDFIYVCVSGNSWKRAVLTTW